MRYEVLPKAAPEITNTDIIVDQDVIRDKSYGNSSEGVLQLPHL